MQEEWRDIKNYPGCKVSNLGNVKNKEKLLKPSLVGLERKYQQVKLPGRKIKYVHRLVAETFIPNTLGKPLVDHINMDTSDNKVNNLRWATYSENRTNTYKRKNLSSIYKGVYKTPYNTWRSEISVNKKKIKLGSFSSEKQAKDAYIKAAQNIYGEYIRLNQNSPEGLHYKSKYSI